VTNVTDLARHETLAVAQPTPLDPEIKSRAIPFFNRRVAQAFDLPGISRTVGAPSFAFFAKGGNRKCPHKRVGAKPEHRDAPISHKCM
jgi:hypothetical protein